MGDSYYLDDYFYNGGLVCLRGLAGGTRKWSIDFLDGGLCLTRNRHVVLYLSDVFFQTVTSGCDFGRNGIFRGDRVDASGAARVLGGCFVVGPILIVESNRHGCDLANDGDQSG